MIDHRTALVVALAVAAPPLAVPVGVTIPVELAQELTSGGALVGQHFAFRTTRQATLGTVVVPAGTPGIGRVASVARARRGHDGSLSLQTDELDLADGRRISVDIDRGGLRGHYATRHVFPLVVPVPPVVVPAAFATRTGDLILDRGTTFDVRTTAPRPIEPPLVGGATPDPALAAPTSAPSEPGS